MNCGVRRAVFYKNVWLHPNSTAFKLHEEKKFKELDYHLQGLK